MNLNKNRINKNKNNNQQKISKKLDKINNRMKK